MLVNMNEMLGNAKIYKYAVPHFNINNLEWTKYILETCQQYNSPVILGVSEGAIKYMGGYRIVANMVKGMVKDLAITIPVVLHLDHGSCYETCREALKAGFSSVMIDASRYDINENIKITKQVVKLAKKYKASVEAEVGHVGGSEDGTANELSYASMDDCIKLAKETKIDALAPALGSVHGIYKGEPKLDFERMKEISEKVNLPLVLHGGTGIFDDQIRKAIQCGTCKINVNTELQLAWKKGLDEFMSIDNDIYDPRKIIGSGEATMKTAIKNKLELFGSIDRV